MRQWKECLVFRLRRGRVRCGACCLFPRNRERSKKILCTIFVEASPRNAFNVLLQFGVLICLWHRCELLGIDRCELLWMQTAKDRRSWGLRSTCMRRATNARHARKLFLNTAFFPYSSSLPAHRLKVAETCRTVASIVYYCTVLALLCTRVLSSGGGWDSPADSIRYTSCVCVFYGVLFFYVFWFFPGVR